MLGKCTSGSYLGRYFALKGWFRAAIPYFPVSCSALFRPMADVEKQSPSPTSNPSLDSFTPRSSFQTSGSQPDGLLTKDVASHDNNKTRAWLTVTGAFLALFCSFGQMVAFGTFQSWYSTHELSSLSEFKISWIGSFQLWAFFFMVCLPQCRRGGKLTVRMPCLRVARSDGYLMCLGHRHSWWRVRRSPS